MWLSERLRENQHLDLSVSIMNFLGLWPTVSGTKKTPRQQIPHLLLWYSYIYTFFLATVGHPMCALSKWGDLPILFESVEFTSLSLMFLVKTGCFARRAERIKDLTDRIHTMCRRPKNLSDNVRTEIAANTQRLTNVLVCLSVLTFVTVFAAMLFRIPHYYNKRQHFASIWLPIDPYESPTFEIVLFLWSFQSLSLIPVVIAMDCFLVSILVQIAGQLQLLSHDIKGIRMDSVESVRRTHKRFGEVLMVPDLATAEKRKNDDEAKRFSSNYVARAFWNELNESMCSRLKELIILHQESIRIFRDFEEIFGPVLLNQILSNVLRTVVAIVYITTLTAFNDKVLLVVTLTATSAVELLVISSAVDLITHESEGIRDAFVSCDWFDQSESFKRSMRIMMSCCNSPLVLKVAAWVPVTRETFLNIVNLTFSNYMALRTAVSKRLD